MRSPAGCNFSPSVDAPLSAYHYGRIRHFTDVVYIVVEKHDYSSSPAHSIAPRRHAARRWVPVTRRALTWIRETRSSAWTIPLSLGPELDAGGVKRYLAL